MGGGGKNRKILEYQVSYRGLENDVRDLPTPLNDEG